MILGFYLDILGPMSIVVLWIRSGIYHVYIYILKYFYVHKFKEPTGVFVHQAKTKSCIFFQDVLKSPSFESLQLFLQTIHRHGRWFHPKWDLAGTLIATNPTPMWPIRAFEQGRLLLKSEARWSTNLKTRGAHTSILHRIFILNYLHDYIKPSRDPSMHILSQKLT